MDKEKLFIYQIKWYDVKEKAYNEEFVRNLQTAIDLMSKTFSNGSTYCTIMLKEIL